MRVWKHWTNEPLTTRKSGSGRRKGESARDDQHLLCIAVNDRTACSMQLSARWSTATGKHDGRIRVRSYTGEFCLPECVIERHSGLIPGVMVWGLISYHGRSNLLRIEGNLNSNGYVREMLQPDVVSFLQGIHRAIFQQDNARPHVAKTVRDICSSRHMQLLPWLANSPDMSHF
ncbi:UNVERIFIED_CONTAM: tc3a [Trichonephila clavipes]